MANSRLILTKTLRSGFALPSYGLGTWGLGGEFEADTRDDAAAIRAIQAASPAGSPISTRTSPP